jgi:hypothetical protein
VVVGLWAGGGDTANQGGAGTFGWGRDEGNHGDDDGARGGRGGVARRCFNK